MSTMPMDRDLPCSQAVTSYQSPSQQQPSSPPRLLREESCNGASKGNMRAAGSTIQLDCYSLYILLTSRGIPGSYRWALFLPTSIIDAADSDQPDPSPASSPPGKIARGRLYQALDCLGRWYVGINTSSIKLSTDQFPDFIVAVKIGTVDEHPALVEDFESYVRSVNVPVGSRGFGPRTTSMTTLAGSCNAAGNIPKFRRASITSGTLSAQFPTVSLSATSGSALNLLSAGFKCGDGDDDTECAVEFSNYYSSSAPRTSREDFNCKVWVKEVLKKLHDSGHITLRTDKGASLSVASSRISISTPFPSKVEFDPNYARLDGEGMMLKENAVNGAVEGLEKEVTALGVLCDPALNMRIGIGYGTMGSGPRGFGGIGMMGKQKVVTSSWTL